MAEATAAGQTKDAFISGLYPCVFSATKECAICFDEIDEGHIIACEHVYCDGCLRQWIDSCNTCPSCRQELFIAPVDQPGSADEEMHLLSMNYETLSDIWREIFPGNAREKCDQVLSELPSAATYIFYYDARMVDFGIECVRDDSGTEYGRKHAEDVERFWRHCLKFDSEQPGNVNWTIHRTISRGAIREYVLLQNALNMEEFGEDDNESDFAEDG